MNDPVASYLASVEAAVAAGRDAPVARLGTVLATGAFEASPALAALLGGRALDLPPPPRDPAVDARAHDALVAWQATVLDWLLRGTVAPVGALGLLCVHDQRRVDRDEALAADVVVDAGQRVSLRPAPRLLDRIAGFGAPPAVDAARVAAALAAIPSGPVDLAALDAALDHLGFRGALAAPAAPPLPPRVARLLARCAGRPIGHLHVRIDASSPTAVQFADDGGGEAWAFCPRDDPDDPAVLRGPSAAPHDCRLHALRLSTWLGGLLVAAALEPLAPADLPAAALAAIAAHLEPLGRPAGELATLLWRSAAWLPARPALGFADAALRVTGVAGEVHVGWWRGELAVPAAQIFDVYPLPVGDQAYLRLWGCFDRGALVVDAGPVPAASAAAAAAHLRLALGLPRRCAPRASLAATPDAPDGDWVDVVAVWYPGDAFEPSLDGVRVSLPPALGTPPDGARVRLRGLHAPHPRQLRVLAWAATDGLAARA